MDIKTYETLIIGPISWDINISHDGKTVEGPGGAVEASSYAAVAGGNKTGVVTKIGKNDIELLSMFNVSKEDIYYAESKETTSIKNQYFTPDKERRMCTAIKIADPFKVEEIPNVKSKIYHLAGLIAGDFDNDMIKELSKRGKVAVDVQGFLRHAVGGPMVFKDWKEKMEYLPYIDFLKTDAKEAEILTGYEDRYEAAKLLYSWGSKEVMITHNTEVIVYDGKQFYTAPLKPRNLSGRTGRGDTCFSAYITERLKKDPEDAIQYAAALTSLKMESPGPFKGTSEDVGNYIKEFY